MLLLALARVCLPAPLSSWRDCVGRQTSWEGTERPNWCLTCGGTDASSLCIVCNATAEGREREKGREDAFVASSLIEQLRPSVFLALEEERWNSARHDILAISPES